MECILEFNPQLAGQDITPANLEFGSLSSRRRDRPEKSLSGLSGLQATQSSSTSAPNRSSFTDELSSSTIHLQTLDPYQSSVEYRLQELTKRLSTLETKLSEDVSFVLAILQRQYPTNQLVSTSSAETLKTNS